MEQAVRRELVSQLSPLASPVGSSEKPARALDRVALVRAGQRRAFRGYAALGVPALARNRPTAATASLRRRALPSLSSRSAKKLA